MKETIENDDDKVVTQKYLAEHLDGRGYITEGSLDSRGYITKDYLDSRDYVNKDYLVAYLDSKNYATKDDIQKLGEDLQDFKDMFIEFKNGLFYMLDQRFSRIEKRIDDTNLELRLLTGKNANEHSAFDRRITVLEGN